MNSSWQDWSERAGQSSLDHAWVTIPRCDCPECVGRTFWGLVGRRDAETRARAAHPAGKGTPPPPSADRRVGVCGPLLILTVLGAATWVGLAVGVVRLAQWMWS